jgi:hypothetical protein
LTPGDGVLAPRATAELSENATDNKAIDLRMTRPHRELSTILSFDEQ